MKWWQVALALGALGCATSPYRRAGNAGDVAAALARSQPSPAAGRNLAFLVLSGAAGPRIAAYDLAASKVIWIQPADVTTRIVVGADVIVHGTKPAGGDAGNAIITGRDIGNGAVLWQRPLLGNERLFGYAAEGSSVFMVVQAVGATARGTTAYVAAVDARTGVERWRKPLPSGRVAGPAARGGLVAVPLESQYIFLLDGATGTELAQVLSTEEAATFVRALPEGLFYGSRGIFLLSPATARGTRQSPGYLQARLPAFVRPFYWYDHYRPEQVGYSALDRNRIVWRATVDGEKPRFRDGLAFVHHYRFFFAFEAGTGTLRWAYNHPIDVVASTDTGRSLLFVTADGELGALDTASGARIYEARLPGEVVRGAAFDAEGFALTNLKPSKGSRPPAMEPGEQSPPGSHATGGKSGAAPELMASLASIIADPDMRFPDLKAFAIEEFGKQPGREVTAKLLEILSKEGVPPQAYRKAGEALVGRRDTAGAEHLATALRRHADYAEGWTAPPVELLARAVGALGTGGRVVAPELSAHLRLPETPPKAAAEIAKALAAVGADDATPALRDFLTMYRADPLYDADPTALIAAAEALLRLGDAGDRELLLFVAEEPHTASGLRAHLARALRDTAGGATQTRDPERVPNPPR